MGKPNSSDVHRQHRPIIDLGGLVLMRALSLLPHRMVLAIGAGTGRLVCAVLRKKRQRIRQNLERIGSADPRGMTWEAGAHVGRTMAEMSWLLWQSRERIDAQIRVHGLEDLQTAVHDGRGVLLAAAHVGNWELGALAAARTGATVHAVARALGSPRTEAVIERFRTAGGVRTLIRAAPGASLAAYRSLRNGQTLACMMDGLSVGQRLTVRFLGAHIRTPLGPLVLARRAAARIVVGHSFRAPDGITDVTFRALPHIDPAHETVESLAHRVAAALEAGIRRHPEQWYWIYRRPTGPGPDPSEAPVDSAPPPEF